MSDTETIRTEPRTEFGSAASRRLRRTGMIPCLVYTDGKEADTVAVEADSLKKAISSPHVIQLEVDGKTRNVLTQEAQWDYLANALLHVDFKEIRMDQKIRTNVPLVSVGDAAGVAAGGTLDQLAFEIEIECLPTNIPEKVEIDVSELEIGDSITFETATMPEGVDAVFTDGHQSLFQVSQQREEEEETEEGAEGEEGVEGEEAAAGGGEAAAEEAAETPEAE